MIDTAWTCFQDIGMDDDASTHLADNMRQLREAHGLTQLQVAKRAEIPRPTWANVESGGANPTLSVLLKVARALSVSPAPWAYVTLHVDFA